MQYVSNGLRALGRGAVIGAVALSMTAPAYAQDKRAVQERIANAEEGVYLSFNPPGSCNASTTEGGRKKITCSNIVFARAYNNPKNEFDALFLDGNLRALTHEGRAFTLEPDGALYEIFGPQVIEGSIFKGRDLPLEDIPITPVKTMVTGESARRGVCKQ